MVTNIHTYKELYTLTVEVRGDRSCCVPFAGKMKYHIRDVINKMACYFPYTQGDLISSIYHATKTTNIAPGSSLYFAGECKTNRDVFRNSGYSIVRDPDKADVTVVPDIRASYYHSLKCNIVAKDEANDELYLVTIDKLGYGNNTFDVEDIEAVRDYLKDVKKLTPDKSQSTNLTVWFIPKCDELADVMNDKYPSRVYCQENKIPIKAPTKISPETLIFWENIDDMNLLARTMCTSDWRDYPVTTLVFLCIKSSKPETNLNVAMTNDFRNLTRTINWVSWYGLESNLCDVNISPKDYAMLQSYIFAKMKLDENGGIVPAKIFNSIPQALRNLLQFRVAIKPMTIPSKMSIEAIEQLAK